MSSFRSRITAPFAWSMGTLLHGLVGILWPESSRHRPGVRDVRAGAVVGTQSVGTVRRGDRIVIESLVVERRIGLITTA
jgi:hypothetical protein